jgi:hypothetical protein
MLRIAPTNVRSEIALVVNDYRVKYAIKNQSHL